MATRHCDAGWAAKPLAEASEGLGIHKPSWRTSSYRRDKMSGLRSWLGEVLVGAGGPTGASRAFDKDGKVVLADPITPQDCESVPVQQ